MTKQANKTILLNVWETSGLQELKEKERKFDQDDLIDRIFDLDFDKNLENYKNGLLDLSNFSFVPILKTQCWFIVDNYEKEIVAQSDNFFDSMGWEKLDLEEIIDNVHPDDLDKFAKNTSDSLQFLANNNNLKTEENIASGEFRVLVHGTYKMVLRQMKCIACDKYGNSIYTFVSYVILNHKIEKDPISEYLYIETEDITKRQLEIVECLSVGLQTKQIAEKLDISFHTVNQHIKNMLRKYHLHNSRELILLAYQKHWI